MPKSGPLRLLDYLKEIFRRLPEYLAFPAARQNENVVAARITSEADLQIVVEAILRLHYADVRAEDYVPAYAGGRSRLDFPLRESGVFIETKTTRQRLRDREVGKSWQSIGLAIGVIPTAEPSLPSSTLTGTFRMPRGWRGICRSRERSHRHGPSSSARGGLNGAMLLCFVKQLWPCFQVGDRGRARRNGQGSV